MHCFSTSQHGVTAPRQLTEAVVLEVFHGGDRAALHQPVHRGMALSETFAADGQIRIPCVVEPSWVPGANERWSGAIFTSCFQLDLVALAAMTFVMDSRPLSVHTTSVPCALTFVGIISVDRGQVEEPSASRIVEDPA